MAIGDLDESARAEALEHVLDCEACFGELRFQRKLHDAIEGMPRTAPPPVYFEGVLAEVHRRMPRRAALVVSVRRLRLPEIPKQVAATMGMMCLAAGWFSMLMTADSPEETIHVFENGSRGSSGGYLSGSFASSRSNDPNTFRNVELVWAPGLGLINADSGLLEMTADQLRELGLTPLHLASGLAMIQGVGAQR
jgi:hypothetical protein